MTKYHRTNDTVQWEMIASFLILFGPQNSHTYKYSQCAHTHTLEGPFYFFLSIFKDINQRWILTLSSKTEFRFQIIHQVIYKCLKQYKCSTISSHFIFLHICYFRPVLKRMKYFFACVYLWYINSYYYDCFCIHWYLIIQEGVTLTIESFSHLAKDSSFSRCCDRSKADKLLGSGKGWNIILSRVKMFISGAMKFCSLKSINVIETFGWNGMT